MRSQAPSRSPHWLQSKLLGLLEAAPDAMLVANERGNIVFANLQTEHLFGYSGLELLGMKVDVLVPPRFYSNHPGHQTGHSDLYGSRKDGSEFPAEISLSSIQTPDGDLVMSAIRDVSKRKLVEAQSKKLNEELEGALRRSNKLAMTGRQVATIAHEINNPLESLINLHYLLSTNPALDDNAKAVVEAAKQEVVRLSRLSQQTLAPYRETQLPVVTKISVLLDEVVSTFRLRLESTHIAVVRAYRTEGIVTLYPSELRQVFTNLISNAVDAMGKGGELSLSIDTMPNREVAVRIADTGCGISTANLDMIFDPFFTTKGENGTGIGLWVTKGIVSKVGGRIEVVSSTTAKKGTCFSVFLSAAEACSCEHEVDADESRKRKRA